MAMKLKTMFCVLALALSLMAAYMQEKTWEAGSPAKLQPTESVVFLIPGN